jgi:hypothetical protein
MSVIPSYVESRDQEDQSSKPAQAKNVRETPSQPEKSWVWWHSCYASYRGRPKIGGPTDLRKMARPYPQNNQSKKGLEIQFKW